MIWWVEDRAIMVPSTITSSMIKDSHELWEVIVAPAASVRLVARASVESMQPLLTEITCRETLRRTEFRCASAAKTMSCSSALVQ